MDKYYVADDGNGEPTIWHDINVVVRRAELPGPHADLLWAVLTGVLTADDATVERLKAVFAEATAEHATLRVSFQDGKPHSRWEVNSEDNLTKGILAVLAALAAPADEQAEETAGVNES